MNGLPPQPPAAPLDAQARKFPCPQCGADTTWHPDSSRLRCGYCGYEREVAAGDAPGTVAERALDGELRSPEKLGWGVERKRYRCARCGAVETLEPGMRAFSCAFCGTPGVVEVPPDAELVRPQGVLPFRISRGDAVGRFRSWLRSLWFRPSDLVGRAEVESVRGIYVPFWTFDADTRSRWRAEAGYRRGSGKNARVEWRPASGELSHRFDDLPVPGSRGIDAGLARGLEPFPTAELVPYDPSYLAGFLAEEYGVPLDRAWATARERMTATLRAACRAEVPGDLCRNLEVETSWSDLACKSGLLPVWIAAYQYRGRVYRYAVNGATGRATGSAPWSWVKIGLAAFALLLLVLFVLSR